MSEADLIERAADGLSLSTRQVRSAMELLDSGATIPFIARYRKERTGGLDEVAVANVRDEIGRLRAIEGRRSAIMRSLDERGLLSQERARILAAESLSALEDIYRPYRPKRRTKASIARERGLEPLARLVLHQGDLEPSREAEAFVDPGKDVSSAEEALAGAREIIAEWISEDVETRATLRNLMHTRGLVRTTGLSGRDGGKYRDYLEYEEPLSTVPSHRILAMMRGAREKILSLHIVPPEERAIALLERRFVDGKGPCTQEVRLAIKDGYRRLLLPSLEREMLAWAKERADKTAISLFAQNLRQILLSPPLGSRTVLAIDPGFRSGCKAVVLDGQGTPLHWDTIYPHPPIGRSRRAGEIVSEMVERFAVSAIAIGNGTAGRETESFVKSLQLLIPCVMVSEAGASVYSASAQAREELPFMDVSMRGAVSIGRRLIDPLAELVKIEPNALGVGQYQHDVDQKALKERLDEVVQACVSAVGVDLNTASAPLLTYIPGLGPTLAKKIVDRREEKGPFRTRWELLDVPRLGPKAFEQAAGFLRVLDGNEPLDATAVHPESYHLVEQMAGDLGASIGEFLADEELRRNVDLSRYANGRVGDATLKSIIDELDGPVRDPRQRLEPSSFSIRVGSIDDLHPGMVLPGMVTNVTAFGAFVDIGVHQDGLVHKSQLSNEFVRDPADVISTGQGVTVRVLDVDLERGRISLSMKDQAGMG